MGELLAVRIGCAGGSVRAESPFEASRLTCLSLYILPPPSRPGSCPRDIPIRGFLAVRASPACSTFSARFAGPLYESVKVRAYSESCVPRTGDSRAFRRDRCDAWCDVTAYRSCRPQKKKSSCPTYATRTRAHISRPPRTDISSAHTYTHTIRNRNLNLKHLKDEASIDRRYHCQAALLSLSAVCDANTHT